MPFDAQFADKTTNQSASSASTDNSMLVASALIIDDESGMRNFLQRALQRRFSLVEVAADTVTAEAIRQRLHFDLLITDIRLPGQSGVE